MYQQRRRRRRGMRRVAHRGLFVAAWVNRAVAAYEKGDTDTAIADLTKALALGDDPALRYNRAIAYQQRRWWREAVDDLTAALALDADNAQDVLVRRATCHRQLGQCDAAQRDLDEHARLRQRTRLTGGPR